MPEKRTDSIATKLTCLAIASTVVVLGANSQMTTTDQKTGQIDCTNFSIATVPVDRNSLSQQILPAQSNFEFGISIENKSSVNTSQQSETRVQSYRVASQSVPSNYELRMNDQKAWGSQPRPASLVSTRVPSAQSPENETIASNQTPIVPGHADPHLWFESQLMQLAVDQAGQQEEQRLPTEPIKFTQRPAVSREEPISVISLRKTSASAPLLFKPLPMDTPAVMTHSVIAPSARTANAWETGRY